MDDPNLAYWIEKDKTEAVTWYYKGQNKEGTAIDDTGFMEIDEYEDAEFITVWAESKLSPDKSPEVQIYITTGEIDSVKISLLDGGSSVTYNTITGGETQFIIRAEIIGEGNIGFDALFEVQSALSGGGRPLHELTQVRTLPREQYSEGNKADETITEALFTSVRTETNDELQIIARAQANPAEFSEDPLYITLTGTTSYQSNDWRMIRMGLDHVIAIGANDDKLYTWGSNHAGQLGYSDGDKQNNAERKNYDRPKEVELANAKLGNDDFWYQLTGGLAHTMALTEKGKLYAWGAILYALPGVTVPGYDSNDPREADKMRPYNGVEEITQRDGSPWVAISAGHSTSFAINEKGDLYGWGIGAGGRLGNGSSDVAVREPVKIEHSKNDEYYKTIAWVKVAAGHNTAYGIKKDGTLWGWGSNENYALGIPGGGIYETPTQITAIDLKGAAWRQVVSGDAYAVGLDTRGNLWTWGDTSHGRGAKNINKTPAIGWDFAVHGAQFPDEDLGTAFALLGAHGSGAAMAISNTGRLMLFGANGYGQLGNIAPGTPPGPSNHYNPQELKYGRNIWWMPHPMTDVENGTSGSGDENRWASIVNGGSTSLAIQRDGTLWAWGDSKWGQAGVGLSGKTQYQIKPIKVTK